MNKITVKRKYFFTAIFFWNVVFIGNSTSIAMKLGNFFFNI